MSEGDQERQLRTPVAFAERVDGIQLSEEMGRSHGQVAGIPPTKLLLRREVCEQPLHFSLDMLGIAKCTSLFGDPDGANFSSPSINVLKQVSVNSAVVASSQATWWKRLAEPL